MERFLRNVEKIALFWWLLLIPTQLGKHFWPEWSHVIGVRSDYLGPILYLSDLLWLIWIGSKTICQIKSLFTLKTDGVFNFENLLIATFVILNIVVAANKEVAIYRWVRIGQWIITYLLVKNQAGEVKKWLMRIIPFWVGVESLLGLAQIVSGGSLQGVWYWLGERRFTLTTVGIAQMSVMGQGLIRAYGTFSHPNSLSGFLLVTLMIWTRLNKNRNWRYWMVTWLGVLGIIISGSRTIWLLLMLIMLASLKLKNIKNYWGTMLILGGVFAMVVGVVGINYRTSDFFSGWDNDSLTKRINLNTVAIKMWKDNYMLGIGAGNFVAKMPEYQDESKFYWLQPVHNIFLLAGTELGMLGVILAVKIMITNFETILKKRNYLILGIVAMTGLVDHYWVTLPQNINLLAVVLALI